MAQHEILQPIIDMLDRRMNRLESKIDVNTTITLELGQQFKSMVERVEQLEAKAQRKFTIPPNTLYLLCVAAVIAFSIVASVLNVEVGQILN